MARITIRELKLAACDTFISTAAMSGLIALTLGTTSCLIGLSSTAVIKLGEVLNPHRNTLKTMMFYGSAGVGAGLFSIGAGMIIAKHVREPMEIEELLEESRNSSDEEFEVIAHIPNVCVGCSNFHGRSYSGVQLICGFYPYGCEGEQCPDWERHSYYVD